MRRILLIVEDSDLDRLAIRRMLADGAAINMELREVETGEDALTAISEDVACVILDYGLPDMTGLDFLKMAALDPRIAVVMLTGIGDATVSVESFRRGAHDFIRKDTMASDTLIHAIDNALDKARLQAEERASREHLKLFHSLVDQTDDILIVVDLKSERVFELNEAARHVMGVDREAIRQQTVRAPQLFPATPRLWTQLRAQTALGDHAHVDGDIVNQEGARIPVEIRAGRVAMGVSEYLVAMVRDVSARKILERELTRSSNCDQETGLGNRTALNIWLHAFWEQAREERSTLGLILIGLDQINDLHDREGPDAAAAHWKRVGNALSERFTAYNECLVRYDDNRLALLTRSIDTEQMEALAEKLRSVIFGLARMNPVTNTFVSAHVGGTLRHANEIDDPASLFPLAETAQRQAVRAPRSTVVITET